MRSCDIGWGVADLGWGVMPGDVGWGVTPT
ncbi:hypothetical protein GA0115246_102572 [Streptomyces sp. SolWspMP-sol7th]|nr:hypothetical protein GA0115246_102572 [Streptomyces sp. SolWspMP-sol7th]